MPKYLLSVYQPDGDPPPPEVLGPVMRDVHALRREMQQAGVWLLAGGLQSPGSASVVRVRDGVANVTDGPYTEGKEHLGGFTIIAVADREAALGWARKFARVTTLPIEVRAFQEESAG